MESCLHGRILLLEDLAHRLLDFVIAADALYRLVKLEALVCRVVNYRLRASVGLHQEHSSEDYHQHCRHGGYTPEHDNVIVFIPRFSGKILFAFALFALIEHCNDIVFLQPLGHLDLGGGFV